MSKLIDADALLKKVDDWCEIYDGIVWNIYKEIEDAPEVEPAKIIHCKDCKQWDAELGCCTSYTIVKCTDGREGVSSDANDFCSRGEPK